MGAAVESDRIDTKKGLYYSSVRKWIERRERGEFNSMRGAAVKIEKYSGFSGGDTPITSPIGEHRKEAQQWRINRRDRKKGSVDSRTRPSQDQQEKSRAMIAVHGKTLGIRSLCQAFEMPRPRKCGVGATLQKNPRKGTPWRAATSDVNGNLEHEARSTRCSNAFRLGSARGRFRRLRLSGGNGPEAHRHHGSENPRGQPTLSLCREPRARRIGEIPCELCRRVRALGFSGCRGSGPGIGRAPLSNRRFCCASGRGSYAAISYENSRVARADSHGGGRILSRCCQESL